MIHRHFVVRALSVLVVLTLGLSAAGSATAQDKVIRLVVGFAPGGTTDILARLIADQLRESLGQTVIVDNRPGAAGRIAAELVRNAAPDGATLMLAPSGPMVVAPHALKSAPYDTLKDFAPVTLAANAQLALAIAMNVPARNVKDYLAWAKANKDKAFYATSGAGTLPHFVGVLFAKEAGVDLTHVPYKGTSAYMNELVSGQVPAAFDAMGDLSEQHKGGKLRIIASAGAKRSIAMPDIPTLREEGYAVEGVAWFSVFAPAATPRAAIDRLSAAIAKAVRAPEVAAKLAGLNMEPVGSPPEECAAAVAADWAKWGAVVRATGFTLD